jgi:hypothetical protein
MKYKLKAAAYGKTVGDEIDLDYADPAVQLNVDAGILEQVGKPGAMNCPACEAEGKKRHTKLSDQAEVEAHYGEHHKGLVAPQWKEGE